MKCPARSTALLLMLALSPSLRASGQFWDFLGYSQVDGKQDHIRVQVVRPELLYRTIQMRISEEAIFLDRLVVHFDGKNSEEIAVRGRVSPAEKSFLIQLPQEGRAVQSVELWYFQEPWGHTPKVILYGLRKDTPEPPAAEPAEQDNNNNNN